MHVLFFDGNVDIHKLQVKIKKSSIPINLETRKSMCADMKYCLSHDKLVIDKDCKLTMKAIKAYDKKTNWIMGNDISYGGLDGVLFCYVVCKKGSKCTKANCEQILKMVMECRLER